MLSECRLNDWRSVFERALKNLNCYRVGVFTMSVVQHRRGVKIPNTSLQTPKVTNSDSSRLELTLKIMLIPVKNAVSSWQSTLHCTVAPHSMCWTGYKGCNSKNVTESLILWPHLSDGVS